MQQSFRNRLGRATLLAAAIPAAGLLCRGVNAQETPDAFTTWVRALDPDPAIPTPESVIGHAVGATAVRYDRLTAYLRALAEASDAVTLTPYARSHEDRTLYYLTITSPANHARLGKILSDNAKLADPRTLHDPDEARRIVGELPAVAWLAYAIHGDELSSTDAAIQVAYLLAAGTAPVIKTLRQELLVMIDPLMNPDGRERYLAQLQTLSGKVPNTDYQALQHAGLWSAGRGNHYLFDLNRDWLMQVHPETRGRAAAILAANPHLVVDSHEMSGLDTYLFDPPREPHNVNLAPANLPWRRRFSADQAAAFDRFGWSYYTQEWYEEWYPGYTNAWANLLGSIGLLYEQAGVNAASVKQASGLTLTYRQAVRHHVTSSLANLQTLAAGRREILGDFLADRRWAVSGEGPFNETFLLPPGRDRSKRARFADLLRRQGIEFSVTDAPIEATDVIDIWGARSEVKRFEPGTLVARSTQPHRRLLHAMLGFDPHMAESFLLEERRELENHRASRIYDVTAWNVPMAYGLNASWAASIAPVVEAVGGPPEAEAEKPAAAAAPTPYAHLIDGRDTDVFRALVMLFDRECRPRVAAKPFSSAGRSYGRGTVLLRTNENPRHLPDVLGQITETFDLQVHAVSTALSDEGPDLGGQRFGLLHRPRVAIAAQWPFSTTSFGSSWYLLDTRLGLRTSPINVQSLSAIDLRTYNVLILPHAWQPELLAAVLGEQVTEKIKRWVTGGGTLIGLGSSAAFLADAERGLSAVRKRRDVLGDLEAYAEAVRRETDARSVTVDPEIVWGGEPPAEGSGEPDGPDGEETGARSTEQSDDPEALKRADEWNRIFQSRGAIVAASVDREHWLCFGLPDRLPVLIWGGYAYVSRHPVSTPVRLVDESHLRLSGLLWPEARTRWAHTAYATVERVGDGQVILMATDPFFRGYFEGSGRLLANAVILGPGMGTSQPLPW